ncbi:hypothetical protein AA313_de0205946 [Arthrobotrys entomopaga]|nr:hypothetical protein AA313_de0205946 [Arthrobotrys entomopaga]
MTRLQAIGRFYVLHALMAKKIPYVIWGLEALACHSVPTFPRDPLEVLVPKDYLVEAAKAIAADRYTFYRRIAPFDYVDDYNFANNISTLVRRNLKECEYLQATRTLVRFQPWQIVLIPDHIFNFESASPMYPLSDDVVRAPPSFMLAGTIANLRVPGFLAMLNALLTTRWCRCLDVSDDVISKELEEQAMQLIIWHIRRDEEAEAYDSHYDLPKDLQDIRDGLHPWNRSFIDHRYLNRIVVHIGTTDEPRFRLENRNVRDENDPDGTIMDLRY